MKLLTSLQASSGPECFSPAALRSLARLSASSRIGRNCFMHSSTAPDWVGGAANGELAIGAAPALGKDAGAGALPKVGGAAGALPRRASGPRRSPEEKPDH